MSDFLDRFRAWFSGGRRNPLALTPSSLAILGREITSAQEVEFDCNDVYRLLDQFAEAVLQGENVEPWMSLIRAHLERCPDCRAEFEALMHTLRTAPA